MRDNFEQLADIMHEELRLQTNLADTLENKLQAMRRHDTAGLEDIPGHAVAAVGMHQSIRLFYCRTARPSGNAHTSPTETSATW